MSQAIFRVADIQRQLDDCAKQAVFPVLDNASIYLADARLHAYRDGARWAMIFEQLGYLSALGGHAGINNFLYVFGNCLNQPPGLGDNDMLGTTEDGDEGPTFDETGQYVSEAAQTIKIRGEAIAPSLGPEVLAAKGIVPDEPGRVKAFELLRALVPEFRVLLLATEEELRQRVPADLPEVLTTDQWHHPNISANQYPSGSEDIRMIIKVLVAGDPTFFKPREKSNTHWKNWPKGGRG